MCDEDDEDRKKPHSISDERKGESVSEAEEHGSIEVGPDGKGHDGRYHHFHVRC